MTGKHSQVDGNAADRLSRLSNHVGTALVDLRNFTKALQLAAMQDDFRNPALYWPSLMEGLARMIPDDEAIERAFAEIEGEVARLMPSGSAKRPRMFGAAADQTKCP